jgi:hypothetical protein
MLNSYRTINSTINEKLPKTDRNGKDYLLLKLDNNEVIFVFDNKELPKDKWTNLSEGKQYEFTVKEGNNGSNLLVDFFSEGDGVFI